MALCPVIDMCYLLSATEEDQVALKSQQRPKQLGLCLFQHTILLLR